MKRFVFYAKQMIHNWLSMMSVLFAILAAAGWIESGHYLRSAAALLYFVIWVLAQYIPGKDGKRHNTTIVN